jgi:hypothetical protein
MGGNVWWRGSSDAATARVEFRDKYARTGACAVDDRQGGDGREAQAGTGLPG